MAEELQSLIEKINRDGIEKAEAKAQEIIAAAKRAAGGLFYRILIKGTTFFICGVI